MTHHFTDPGPTAILQPGDTVDLGGGRQATITREGLACDCGKGALCPLNPQRQTNAEDDCRLFLATFPGPAAHRAVAHAEAGDLTWEQIRDLFARSIATSLEEWNR